MGSNGNGTLTTGEMTRAELARNEKTIENGRQAFVEVGNALRDIRDRHGYRFEYGTFDEYCKERWGFNQQSAHYYMDSAEIAKSLPAETSKRLEVSKAIELARLVKPSDKGNGSKKEIDFEMVNEVAKGIDFAKATVKQVAAAVDSKLREIKQDEKKATLAALPDAPRVNGFELDSITVCDIANVEIPDESVDMVFTDPPYHDEYIDLYGKLALLARRALKPGGILMAYCGKMFFPEILNALQIDGLEYVWVMSVYHAWSNAKISKHNILENWRPIVVFKKVGKTETREWVQDTEWSSRNKEFHDWQQDIESPRKYIAAYTLPGQIVLDPFVGGGTTPTICKELKRHYVCFDVDPDAVKLSIKRVNDGR